MKQQKVVRTYPRKFINPTLDLREALKGGWVVVMSNPFDCGNGEKGTEYILEKAAVQK
ncbi:hypothetical protein [Paenibacillus brevis]|uniref:Uncharacterized protein n=1 Tax=Paenibacillus brevis TaxID=2841508 RepID=A0ABS6FR34_9BACL|nr:hypothetical protein [Paenibacillus brevis]MBU5672699.1 hypothetical protein [Paenibacillus brevis]